MIKKVWQAIKFFFMATFRPHSGEEYSEILTRGLRSDRYDNNRHFPWFYLRLFVGMYLVLCSYLLVVRWTGYNFYLPTIIVFGGVITNLTFLIFLYELYPRKDLSLISVFCSMILGGTLASVLCQLVFYLVSVSDIWWNALYVAVVEEAFKIITAIIIITINRNRNPLAGFIIAASVGAGFAIGEDIGYLFDASNAVVSGDISFVVLELISRGLTAACTHVMWTGLLGWAFLYFSHWKRPLFCFPCLLAVGVHALWNMPFEGMFYVICLFLSVIATLICGITLLSRAREEVLVPVEMNGKLHIFSDKPPQKTKRYYRHLKIVYFFASLVFCATVAMGYCAVPAQNRYEKVNFESTQEFVSYMQCGLNLQAQERAYGKGDWGEEYAVDLVEGVVKGKTLRVCYDTMNHCYYYYSYHFPLQGKPILINSYADVIVDGNFYHVVQEKIYFRNSGKNFVYYPVRKVVQTQSKQVPDSVLVNDDDTLTVLIYQEADLEQLSAAEITMITALCASIAFGAIGILICEIKQRRIKNVRL